MAGKYVFYIYHVKLYHLEKASRLASEASLGLTDSACRLLDDGIQSRSFERSHHDDLMVSDMASVLRYPGDMWSERAVGSLIHGWHAADDALCQGSVIRRQQYLGPGQRYSSSFF